VADLGFFYGGCYFVNNNNHKVLIMCNLEKKINNLVLKHN